MSRPYGGSSGKTLVSWETIGKAEIRMTLVSRMGEYFGFWCNVVRKTSRNRNFLLESSIRGLPAPVDFPMAGTKLGSWRPRGV